MLYTVDIVVDTGRPTFQLPGACYVASSAVRRFYENLLVTCHE